jgi:hypothetical protein
MEKKFKHGQLSLEALLSLAALLAALALLISAADKSAYALQKSALQSAERHSLSYEALALDSAATSLSSSEFSHSLYGIPSSDAGWLISKEVPQVREPVLHKVSSDREGKAYVQRQQNEPV